MFSYCTVYFYFCNVLSATTFPNLRLLKFNWIYVNLAADDKHRADCVTEEHSAVLIRRDTGCTRYFHIHFKHSETDISSCQKMDLHVNKSRQSSSWGTLQEPASSKQQSFLCFSRLRRRWYTPFLSSWTSAAAAVSSSSPGRGCCPSCETCECGTARFWRFSSDRADRRFS